MKTGRRLRRSLRGALLLTTLAVAPAAVHGQELLDRVVARVGGSAITQTDVDAALALGIVEASGPDRLAAATQQMVDRRLLLAEVARFPPREPADAAVDERLAAMKARAGGGYEALLRRTGLDEARLRDMARDTLRIQAYIDQRFGTTAQVSVQEAREYYDAHPQAFTRNGTRQPFEEVEAEARLAASAARRQRLLAQWLADLRTRGDVVEVTPPR
jgi:hypothetical protein